MWMFWKDDCSFTTQIWRKGTLENDIPDPLVSLSLLWFLASFWMFKRVSLMGSADWIWIPLKGKKKKKKAQNYVIQASLYLFLK